MNALINQQDFLIKYNIKEEDFNATTLTWEELSIIFDDYKDFTDSLEPIAVMVFNILMKSKSVHSVRYRLKDPEHLIEKIIRKRIERPNDQITIENYRSKITDLIGIRALHLFKEDWESIHEFVTEKWELDVKPVVNYRNGDSEESLDRHKQLGCDTKQHKAGYRSVHYILKTKPAKEDIYVELQVRTIFEEAWSEIDHVIRYPYDTENPLFSKYLMTFNRLAGSADEMGSFIAYLKSELEETSKKHSSEMLGKDKLIKELELKVNNSKITKSEKEVIIKGIKEVSGESLNTSELGKKVRIRGMSFDEMLARTLKNNVRLTIDNETGKIIRKSDIEE